MNIFDGKADGYRRLGADLNHTPGHGDPGERDRVEERPCELVVGGCDTTKVFWPPDGGLDSPALAIAFSIAADRLGAVAADWDDSFRASSLQAFAKDVGVISPIGDQLTKGTGPLDERWRRSDTGVLAVAEIERRLGIAERMAGCITDPLAPERGAAWLSSVLTKPSCRDSTSAVMEDGLHELGSAGGCPKRLAVELVGVAVDLREHRSSAA